MSLSNMPPGATQEQYEEWAGNVLGLDEQLCPICGVESDGLCAECQIQDVPYLDDSVGDGAARALGELADAIGMVLLILFLSFCGVWS